MSLQGKAKQDLHAIYEAENRKEAEAALDRFVAKYGPKYDKAVACLAKDREALLAFYAVPAEHWKHVRTTNPIESTFATVRLRTVSVLTPERLASSPVGSAERAISARTAGVVRALGWIESIRPFLLPGALARGRRSARRTPRSPNVPDPNNVPQPDS